MFVSNYYVSEKINPVLNTAINVNHCPDGAPHIHIHLAAGVPWW